MRHPRRNYPRRRPSDAWTLWRIDADAGKRAGYLVTGGERNMTPIAFVAAADAESLAKAVRIRQRPALAASALDLRNASHTLLHDLLGNVLLLPVDSRGRQITTDRIFAAGYFSSISHRCMDLGGEIESFFGFVLLTHAGLEFWRERNRSSAASLTSTPGDNEGESAAAVTAA